MQLLFAFSKTLLLYWGMNSITNYCTSIGFCNWQLTIFTPQMIWPYELCRQVWIVYTIKNGECWWNSCWHRWPSESKGDYSALFKDVASAIRNGTPQAVKWEESAEVIEIIELAYKSSKEGATLDIPPRNWRERGIASYVDAIVRLLRSKTRLAEGLKIRS